MELINCVKGPYKGEKTDVFGDFGSEWAWWKHYWRYKYIFKKLIPPQSAY
jgi:hypothetical protein